MRKAGPLPVAVAATAGEYLAERRALLDRRMGEINIKAAADALDDLEAEEPSASASNVVDLRRR